ncbi:transporter [Robertkochia marina]|uniref:Transporter n=1 Tax=Robertkochia marina TaxID=1227945 RepID=A0A4S3M385_9FLAO|nr:transporter [Robertkochia marina]THD69556.1 transporter [Robertkochia marina]TRZ47187.1 transporter [Robertkochia marina]
MKKLLFTACILTTILLSAQAPKEDLWTADRPDGQAPISVLGDHMHNKGEWMFSYRFMQKDMANLKTGTDDASFADALDRYMVSPANMSMQIHMLGVMFAPAERITLMVRANYISLEMDHTTRMMPQDPGVFTTQSSGFADTKVTLMYGIHNGSGTHLHAQLGVSLPTGSIDITDQTPASAPNEMILSYPMQPGSGTYDLEPAMTWLDQWKNLSSGMQIRGTFRLGENDNDYHLGHRISIQKWLAGKISPWLSISGRLEWGAHGKISGANPILTPSTALTADTENSGKTYANAGFGVNLYAFKGILKDLRLGAEAILPVYQNLYGIQLKEKNTLVLGLQYTL